MNTQSGEKNHLVNIDIKNMASQEIKQIVRAAHCSEGKEMEETDELGIF